MSILTARDPATVEDAVHTARFLAVDLAYGCHRGSFSFPDVPRPVVILGPNGAGKSTLLEALVRGLYGFNRQVRGERARMEDRSPWNAVTYRIGVTLASGDREWTVERDLVSMEVVIRGTGEDPWVGDGNPGASNVEAREYRDRIGAIFGLRERDAYTVTACIHQDELVSTELGDHLLRVASGGHASVEAAREAVQEAHRQITTTPIHSGASAAKKARRLQETEASLLELRAKLERSVQAEKRRAPIVRENDAVEERRDEVTAEIDALERMRTRLVDRRADHSDRRRLEDRIRTSERLLAELAHATASLDTAEARWAEASSKGTYPEDFPERAVRAESLWKELGRMETAEARMDDERQRSPTSALPPLAGALVAVLGIVLMVAGLTEAGLVLILAGGAAAAILGIRTVRGRRRAARLREERATLAAEETDIRDRLQEIMSDVPGGEGLDEAGLREARADFDRQRRAATACSRARQALEPLCRRIREDLEDQGEAPDTDHPPDLERALRQAVNQWRDLLARRRVEMEGADRAVPTLPEGVSEDEEGISQALDSRRLEARELTERSRELVRRLVEEASPSESSLALRDRIDAVEREMETLRNRAVAHEKAYALISDAYQAFRDRDQERLVDGISRRLDALTGGKIGPMEADGPLSEATVRVGARSLVFDSPPLSYGEYHAALLAVRLGSVDFLASAGIAPPLLVDEPFAHLDEDRCREVWRLLESIAEGRQVIITTQNRLMLDQLEISPDIELDPAAPPEPA